MTFLEQSVRLSPGRVATRSTSYSPRFLVSQIGAREMYACPVGFEREGRLRHFYTDLWCPKMRDVVARMPSPFWGLSGRFHPELPRNKVVAFTGTSLADELSFRLRNRRPTTSDSFHHFESFGSSFAKRVRKHLQGLTLNPGRDVLFAFSTGALESLEFARARHIPCVVDQIDPARVDQEMMLEESRRWQGWDREPGAIPESYYNRLEREWALADVIVVNSEFSRQAIHSQGVPLEKIVVVPLAYELESPRVAEKSINTGRPLQVLWLGQVVLRKGIPYLFEAARRLLGANIQFTVAGRIGISEAGCRAAPENVKILGRVTRDEAVRLYQESDVFVLPTISDGFAITQLEAMSYGLPVIATPNCGDVVTAGEDGLIVPIRDPERLADAIALFDRDRQALRYMSRSALTKSTEFTLHRYASTVTQAVTDLKERRDTQREDAARSDFAGRIEVSRSRKKTVFALPPKRIVRDPVLGSGFGYSLYNYYGRGLISRAKRRRFQIALDLGDPQPGEKAIDMGSADGVLVPTLSDAYQSVLAIDHNPEFAKCCGALIGALKLTNARSICNRTLSAEDILAEHGNDFDVMYLLETLEHVGRQPDMWQSKMEFLEDCFSLLKPGGRIIVSVPKMVGPAVVAKNLLQRGLRLHHDGLTLSQMLKSGILYQTDALEQLWDGGHVGFNHRKLERHLAERFKIVRRKKTAISVFYVLTRSPVRTRKAGIPMQPFVVRERTPRTYPVPAIQPEFAGAPASGRQDAYVRWYRRPRKEGAPQTDRAHDILAVAGMIRDMTPEFLAECAKRDIPVIGDQMRGPAAIEMLTLRQQMERNPGWARDDEMAGLEEAKSREEGTWKAVTHVMCGSEYLRAGLVHQGVEGHRISVVPYPIQADEFTPPDRSGRRGPVTVGFLGDVSLRNGAPAFLKVAANFRLAAARGKMRFVMVGTKRIADSVAKRYGDIVEFVEAASPEETQRWLAEFDLLLAPATCAGWSEPVMEAMAMGLPVVSTFNAGTPVRDGYDGFICPMDDIDALAGAVEQLACEDALRLEMGETARVRAEEFTAAAYAKRLSEIVEGLTGEKPEASGCVKAGKFWEEEARAASILSAALL